MSFVQVMEFSSSRGDEIQAIEDEWRAQTEGKRTTVRSIVGRDHTDPDHYMVVVEFPSYEAAMQNSELPETQRMADRIRALCDGPIRYTDLDVFREDKS